MSKLKNAAKVKSGLSFEMNTFISERTRFGHGLTEIARDLNEELKRLGHRLRLSANAVNQRRRTLFPDGIPEPITDPKHLTFTLSIPANDVAGTAGIWNEVHVRIIKQAYEESRRYYKKNDLARLKTRLLEVLRDPKRGNFPQVTISMLSNFIAKHREEVGLWGGQKPKEQEVPKKVRQFAKFARVWNNKKLTSGHDLIEAMKHELGEMLTLKGIDRLRSKYDSYRKKNPEFERQLVRLSRRHPTTGRIVPMHPAALEQIERFRVSRKQLRQAKGLVVMSAQIGASFIPAVQTFKKIADELGYTFVGLPLRFGPIKTHDGRLESNFAPELEDSMLFEDFVYEERRLLLDVSSFLLPTLYTKLSGRVARMKSGLSRIIAGTNIEFKHLPLQGEDGTRHIMTAGTATRLVLNVDALGHESTRGVVTQNDVEIAAWVISFKGKRKWFARPLIMLDEATGEVYDIDPKHGGARLYTADGSEHRPNDIVAVAEPDWHDASTDPEIAKALWGKHGIMPTLKPDEVYRHDGLDTDSPACPFWLKQMSRSAALAGLGFDLAEEEVDAFEKRLVEHHKILPNAEIVIVAANHPAWLTEWAQKCLWREDSRNYAFGSKLCYLMAEETTRRVEEAKTSREKRKAVSPEALEVLFNGRYPWLTALGRQDERYAKTTGKYRVCLSSHGDVAPKGNNTRSLGAFTVYGNKMQYIVGHGHTGEKLLNVWRVGTAKGAYGHYFRGPITGSDWTATTGAVFKNGQIMSLEIKYGSEWYV